MTDVMKGQCYCGHTQVSVVGPPAVDVGGVEALRLRRVVAQSDRRRRLRPDATGGRLRVCLWSSGPFLWTGLDLDET